MSYYDSLQWLALLLMATAISCSRSPDVSHQHKKPKTSPGSDSASTSTPSKDGTKARAPSQRETSAQSLASLFKGPNKPKILVAYFSWSGNTRAIAKHIAEKVSGQLFEIVNATPYSTDYDATVKRAKVELRASSRPKLKAALQEAKSFDIIFLGYPNWWNTFPMPVATFLKDNDFSGKPVIPFCTHGGGGIGVSLRDLRQMCPQCKIKKQLTIHGRAAKSSGPKVDSWLRELGALR